MSFLRCLITACTLSASLHAAEDKMRLVRETDALTPEQERSGLHVPPGFTVQLFASEPMINKPINMAFDARGRLWVSSTVEYPYAADKSRWSDEKGTRVKDSRDAIKILADTDGDGKADKATDFADGLNIPTGVLPWHKPEHKAGCIAWSIPNIWYFADTDGDDKADHREILFGPLGYEKDTHGMCSSFRLGLDGWVYATHGFNNTSHLKAKDGSTLDLHSGNVFRFRPDGSRVEKWTSGQVNPFGLCWDRFGNLYSADCHSSPIYQLIRGASYPSFGKPDDGLGFAPVMCEHSHGSTGICGIVYLDGGVWGPEWDDHTLVGNCVTSRVNHDTVTFTGSTPKANEQPDFITSDDPWFRPVDLQLGPDNALYIADFYNKIIGHYEVPLDHPGRDKERGRIWRVVKAGKEGKLGAIGDIDEFMKGQSTDPILAGWALANANSCVTRLAGSMAVNIQEAGFAEGLAEMAKQRLIKGNVPGMLAMEVATLHGLNPADGRHLLSLLSENYLGIWKETDPVALANLLRCIGETSVWNSSFQDIVAAGLLHDESRVKSAAVVAAAAHPQAENIRQLMRLLSGTPANDISLRYALRLAVRAHLMLPGEFDRLQGNEREIADELAMAVPTSEAAEYLLAQAGVELTPAMMQHVARYITTDQVHRVVTKARAQTEGKIASQIDSITALHNGLSERGAPDNPELLQWAQQLATQLLNSAPQQPTPVWTSSGDALWSLQPRKCTDGTQAQVLQSMAKGGGNEEKRSGILKSKDFPAPAKLVVWINGHRGAPTSKAHDKNLVRVVDAQSGATLASIFPPRHNDCRREKLDLSAYMGKSVHLEIIDGDDGKAYAWLGITRIEPAVVSVNDFQSADTTRESLKTLATMLQHSAPAALREKLAAYLPPRPAPPPLPVSPEQRKQLDTLIAARVAAFAKAKPDLETGANVFKMNCAACHQIKGEGGLIGPQLDGIGARGPARLCEDILDPNRNVDAHFHLHTLTLKDSSTFAGFLKAELGQVNVLADATGKEHRIGKKDIVKTEVTPISLMPPTFGQTIEEATFMDLLGYLLNEKAGK
jgi:putative heme-binding domain-containing protein